MAANAASAPGGGAAMHVCKLDAEKLCSGVKPGEGRIVQMSQGASQRALA